MNKKGLEATGTRLLQPFVGVTAFNNQSKYFILKFTCICL